MVIWSSIASLDKRRKDPKRMRGRTLSKIRRLLPVALCLGSLAMVGCPKMPRISPNTPTPTPDASATPTADPTPTPEPEPTADPTPNAQPTVLTQTVGPAPRSIAVDSAGGAFVTLAGDIARFNPTSPATFSLAATPFPAAGGITLNGSGTVLWFTQGSKVQAYTLGTPPQPETYEFGGTPKKLVLDGPSNAWVMDAQAGAARVGVIRANSNPLSAPLAKALPRMPVGLLVDVTNKAWVLSAQSGEVRVVGVSPDTAWTDLDFNPDVAVIGLNEAYGIAVDAPGALWITGKTAVGQGKLVKLDRNSGAPVGTPFDLPFTPGPLAIRGGFAWVAGDASIHKVSLTSGEVVDTIPTGGKAAEVFKDSQQDLWLPITGAGTVVKLDF